MAAPIQRLARAAFQCFSRKQQDSVFNEQVKTLTSLLNSITAKDVGFDPLSVRERRTDRDAPVTYVHIWEDEVFSMGIFVVKPGGRLPMHDHPDMFGFCKVIHGSVRLRSFTEATGHNIPEDVEQGLSRWQKSLVKSVGIRQDRTFGVNDPCCFLTPNEGNIHEILPDGGVTAFLDILAPPYNQNNRDCHYFKELSSVNNNMDADKSLMRWLIQVPQPLDYWCDSLEYRGPVITI